MTSLESLGRPLRMKADWGTANFYRICGWIAHGLFARYGRPGLCVVETGQAWVDNIQALVKGDVDVTIATPTEFGTQALLGLAQFEGEAHGEIRALGVLPHDDAILFAVPAESPIDRFEDILESRYPLRLSAPPDDGACHAGWACQAILDAYGLTREVVEGQGGSYLYREFPRYAPSLVLAGLADAVMNEAMMLPQWRELAERRPVRFLSIAEDVLSGLQDKYRMKPRWVHAGRFPGQESAFRTVDFSGWMVIATESLPDEVAYALTSVMVETRTDLDRMYSGSPLNVSPLTYPIQADHMAYTGEVPLHAGAERYYRERGLFDRW